MIEQGWVIVEDPGCECTREDISLAWWDGFLATPIWLGTGLLTMFVVASIYVLVEALALRLRWRV